MVTAFDFKISLLLQSYEKQNFHSATPPPFNMANTQTAGGTSAQPYGMYLPTMPAAAGHHMIHPQIHQVIEKLFQLQKLSLEYIPHYIFSKIIEMI